MNGAQKKLSSVPHTRDTAAIVHNLHRGRLRYPNSPFISFLMTLESTANNTQSLLFMQPKPLANLVERIAPVVLQDLLLAAGEMAH